MFEIPKNFYIIHPEKLVTKVLTMLACLMSFNLLHPVELELIKGPNDIAATHKAYVRFVFQENDCAIFKDTITISIDTPAVRIVKWNVLTQASSKYFAAFRSNRRVFVQTCTAEIRLASHTSENFLHQAHLTIAGIAHHYNGKNSPFSQVIALTQPSIDYQEQNPLITTSTEYLSSQSYSYTSASTTSSKVFYDHLTQEFQIIETLAFIWKEVIYLFNRLFSFNIYRWWYCLLFLLLATLLGAYLTQLLRSQPANKHWFIQGFWCLVLIIGLSSLRFAAPLFQNYFAEYLASCVVVMASAGFFSLLTSHEQSIWGKVKGIIAWICLVSTLPMATYSYLAWSGLL